MTEIYNMAKIYDNWEAMKLHKKNIKIELLKMTNKK